MTRILHLVAANQRHWSETDAPPKVLQVTASSERRGAETFAHQLATALEASGIAVSTVAVSDRRGASPLPFRSLGRARFRPSTLLRLLLAVRRAEVTIVHGGSGLLPTALVAGLARRPFIYRGIGDPTYWGDVRFGSWRIGMPLRRAQLVVALYERAAQQLVDLYGLDPERMAVIPNAVPLVHFSRPTPGQRRSARAALGLGDDDLVLGYAGALSSEKRPEWAVQVAARIQGAQLAMAGGGAAEPELRDLADRLAPGRVHFAGTVTDPAAFLAALDVLLVPSRTEGVPAIVIEAALVGVPVVATAVGGVPHLIADLGTGTVSPPDDMEAFHRATLDAVRSGRPNGPPPAAVVDRHDIETVVGQWRDLIRESVLPTGVPSGRRR